MLFNNSKDVDKKHIIKLNFEKLMPETRSLTRDTEKWDFTILIPTELQTARYSCMVVS